MTNDETVVVAEKTKKFPFMHKIDMYGSLFLLWMFWEVPYMINVIISDHVNVFVPFEMLLHGPIILNPSAQGLNDRLICNPHFHTFLGSPAYLTDDFMGSVLTKAKSDRFLDVVEVKNTLQELYQVTNNTRIYIGIRLNEVCELNPSNLEVRGCITYATIFDQCLKQSCGDKLFLCWWEPLSLISVIIYCHVISFVPGFLVMCLIMFDPPPDGFRIVAKPGFVGASYCTSSVLAFVYAVLTGAEINNYFDQPEFFRTFDDPDNGYDYNYGNGFVFSLIGASVNFIFGCFYCYVALFSPSYPRHKSRVLQRRGYFREQIKKLKEDAGISAVKL